MEKIAVEIKVLLRRRCDGWEKIVLENGALLSRESEASALIHRVATLATSTVDSEEPASTKDVSVLV